MVRASDMTRWTFIRPTDPPQSIPVYRTPSPAIGEVWSFLGSIAAGATLLRIIPPEEGYQEIKGLIRANRAYEFRVLQGYNADNIIHVSSISGVANETILVDITRRARYLRLEMRNLDTALAATAIITLIDAKT